jgi:hypothetical protein
LQRQLPWREFAAEGTTPRTLHDGWGEVEADFAIAGRDDAEIGRTYEQRAEFGRAST